MKIKLILDIIVSKIKELAKLYSGVPIFFLLFYTNLAQFLAKVPYGIIITLNWFEPLLLSLNMQRTRTTLLI